MSDSVFTTEELEKIDLLHTRIKEWDLTSFPSQFLESHNYTDKSTLWRFLMAREFKVDAAEAMLRHALSWKNEMNIDDLLEEFRGNGTEKSAIKRTKSDRAKAAESLFGGGFLYGVKSGTGGGIMIERLGKVDFAGLSKHSHFADLYALAYSVFLEEGWRHVRSLGAKRQSLYIIDLTGLGFSAIFYIGLVKKIASIGPASYPEISETVILANAPAIVAKFWKLLGPLIPKNTKKKVLIPETYELQQVFDDMIEGGRKMLPSFLGGENKTECICPALSVKSVEN